MRLKKTKKVIQVPILQNITPQMKEKIMWPISKLRLTLKVSQKII